MGVISAWPSGLARAPSCFTAHELDGSRVQTFKLLPIYHPSWVSKLVAISMQWVTAVEDKVKRRLYDGWRVDYEAGWRKLPYVGFLQFAGAPWKWFKLLKAPNEP
jgi:hypothetical protein